MKTWQLECVERLHQSKLALLCCVVNDTSASSEPASLRRLYAAVPSTADVDSAELFRRVPGVNRFDRALSGSLSCEAACELPAVDFFLLLGEPASGMPLSSAARYGVWYFAHGDLTRFTTAAPGFWEIHGDHDVTAAYLLRLAADGAAGQVLKCGFLPTLHHSFEANVGATHDAIVKWPQHVCWDILQGAATYFDAPPLPMPAMHYGLPGALDVARVRLQERRHRAVRAVRDHFYAIEWTVGRVRESPAQFIGSHRRARVSYLYRRSKARYLADPCVVVRGSNAYLFCEEYRRESRHGAVAVSEITNGDVGAPRPAIEEPHHLSYPHVFEHGGQTYCVPESGGIRKVCLYRCVDFPYKWEYVHTLIDGFEAADSTIVRYGDRWWLFCTSSEETVKGFYSHLYVWHAPDLLGSWTQHVRNPVKIDARSARPAGPFFEHDGVLYRPAQDCSRSYGGAVRINRIDKLTETEFEESVVGTIRPPRYGYTRGLHTLCAAGDWCVVDVERYRFDALNARYTCTQLAQRALQRLGVSEQLLLSIRRRLKAPQHAPQRAALHNPQPSESE